MIGLAKWRPEIFRFKVIFSLQGYRLLSNFQVTEVDDLFSDEHFLIEFSLKVDCVRDKITIKQYSDKPKMERK